MEKRTTRRHYVWIGLLGLCFALARPCEAGPESYSGAEPTGSAGQPIPLSSLGKSAIGLSSQTVSRQTLPLQITTPGKIEAIPSRVFSEHAPVSGRISKVLVSPGEHVKAGQILLYLDSQEISKLAADLLQTKASLEADLLTEQTQFDDDVKQAQSRNELAIANYTRDQTLFNEKIGSEKAVAISKSEMEIADARIKAAVDKRRIILAALKKKVQLALDPLRQRLETLGVSQGDLAEMAINQRAIISIPVRTARSGVITEMYASPGQAIDTSVKLFTVSDLSRVWATAQVYEEDMERARVGQRAVAHVDALPRGSFQGLVAYVADVVDARSRTLPVRVELANPDLKLKPDMYASLSIATREPAQAIILPRDAVIQQTGHYIVFFEKGDSYQPTFVQVGRSLGDNVEILGGIEPGQKVVTRGAFQLEAELLKSRGNKELFVQPTEGEREEPNEAGQRHFGGMSPQLVAILAAAAFALGFVFCAIFLKAKGASPTDRPHSQLLSRDLNLDEQRHSPSAEKPMPPGRPVPGDSGPNRPV